MKCSEKVTYHNAAMAEAARVDLIRRNKTDKRNARLVCYTCRDCGNWHVGHLRRITQQAAPVPKQVKGPKPGQLRRAAAKAAEKVAKQELYADWTETLRFVRLMADREIARMEALGVPKRAVQQP
jgi:hypothetical protein